jgi:hypothetical protein
METLYDLLGALPRDDAEGLRVAFRRAVKGAHPDLNPGDPDAGFKFRQIVRANEILGDTDQRAAYDHLLDLAHIEQRQSAKRAVAHTIYQITSGVISFCVALTVIAGGYLAVMQFPDDWSAPLAQVAAAVRQSTVRQSSEAAAAIVRQVTEPVTAAVSQPPVAVPEVTASTDLQAGAAPDKPDRIDLPPEPVLPTAVTLQTDIGGPPTVTIAPPLDLTLLDAKSYREQGIVAYRNGDLNGAIANFDQAIQLDPKFAAAYIDRGIVFYRLRKFERAFADIAHAKRIERSGRTRPSPAQSVVKKPRPPVELSPAPPPRRQTANLDPSREEGFASTRRP